MQHGAVWCWTARQGTQTWCACESRVRVSSKVHLNAQISECSGLLYNRLHCTQHLQVEMTKRAGVLAERLTVQPVYVYSTDKARVRRVPVLRINRRDKAGVRTLLKEFFFFLIVDRGDIRNLRNLRTGCHPCMSVCRPGAPMV